MSVIGRFVEDRFEITDVIGEGGMSIVYGAKDRVSGKRLALKVLKQGSTDPANRERFLREAQTQGQVVSPHVARIYHFGRDMDLNYLYIAMEFCDGDELFRLLEYGRLPLDLTCEIAIQTCRGLQDAHDQTIVHRDIKPTNILLVPRRGILTVKLLDFGYVRIKDAKRHLTQDGFVGGTLSYVSPEELELGELDHRLDIYSLGCIMYEMLTGRLPFEAKTPQATAVMHLSTPAPRLAPEFGPPELADLILWMMEKNAAARPSSAAEVAEYLEAIRAGQGIEPPSIGHTGRSSDPRRDWSILEVS